MVKVNIPKKIHLTCKDKNNIDNIIWKKCLEKYRLIYPDYEIIISANTAPIEICFILDRYLDNIFVLYYKYLHYHE